MPRTGMSLPAACSPTIRPACIPADPLGVTSAVTSRPASSIWPSSSSPQSTYPSAPMAFDPRSEEHTSELQSRFDLVCRLLLEKKNKPMDEEHRNHLAHQHTVLVHQRRTAIC